MDRNEELLVGLEMAKSKVVTAWKLAEEGACLLRKTDEEKEASQVEACQLAKEKTTMMTKKEKTKNEIAQLRRELQDLRARFAAQKKDLETNYQKQVDDKFFYGYRCCMKKHDITNDTPNFPFDDDDDEFLGGPIPRDKPMLGDGHAPGDVPFAEDGSHGERT